MNETAMKCPHCGMTYLPSEVPPHLRCVGNLVPEHFLQHPDRCPGSWQTPRNAESDNRPLWKREGASMTVAELIRELQRFPDNHEIVFVPEEFSAGGYPEWPAAMLSEIDPGEVVVSLIGEKPF